MRGKQMVKEAALTIADAQRHQAATSQSFRSILAAPVKSIPEMVSTENIPGLTVGWTSSYNMMKDRHIHLLTKGHVIKHLQDQLLQPSAPYIREGVWA